MNKNAIKKFAIEARKKLIASVSDRAGMFGITPEGCSEPVAKGVDFEVYKTIAGTEVTLSKSQCEQRRKLKEQIETRGFEAVVEEVAYTWFNRICAIRFMEVNDYLPTRVRVLSSEKEGKNEPDIVTQAPDVDLDFTDKEREYILDCKMNNKLDELFKMLFIKQCNKLSEILPELFEATEDYTEMLLNISYTNNDDIVYMLVNQETGIPEADFNVSTIGEDGQPTGQVEIIGWLYQYYNTELKDDTFAQLKKNVKISKERIPAATQLFTPDWIVRYMVENSVGRLWIEHLRAVDPTVNEKEVAEKFGWKYYLPEAEQEADVNVKLAEIRTSYRDLKPEDITCIDPCMGSGHILVAMFDVLMDIYKSAGYSERDAAFEIVEHNIHGLDIDKRAYQLAYFAVMMKGRMYNRRFFRGRDDLNVSPKIYVIQESNAVNKQSIGKFGYSMNESEKNKALGQINMLMASLLDAREYGSILKIDDLDWKLLEEFVGDFDESGQMSFEMIELSETRKNLLKLIRVAKILSMRFECVVTNPPYMASAGMTAKLLEYVKDNYEYGKNDFYSIFMLRCITLCQKDGYVGVVTPESWMFLSRYEKLRNELLHQITVSSLCQLGDNAFEAGFGTVAYVFRKGLQGRYLGKYYRLVKYNEEEKRQRLLTDTPYITAQNIFEEIEGSPFAYWISRGLFEIFKNTKKMDSYAQTKVGLQTSNNERFIRMWPEVNFDTIRFGIQNTEATLLDDGKWYPHNKGGEYRKWFGNNLFVVDWYHDGFNIKKEKQENLERGLIEKKNSKCWNSEYYFKECLTWSRIGFSNFGVRYSPEGSVFDTAGTALFADEGILKYILALLNTQIVYEMLQIINPTLNYQTGDISKVPLVLDEMRKDEVISLVDECLSLAESEWDDYELSWNYRKHPFLRFDGALVEERYLTWKEFADSRWKLLKDKEQQLNSIFAKIYDVEDEFHQELPDEEITLRKAELKKDICSFLSYFVGCVFGRYSFNAEGIQNRISESSLGRFRAVSDGILLLSKESFIGDNDIIRKLEDFVVDIFGEDTLEQNLEFIASVLDENGESSRMVIRNYFVSQFAVDHAMEYSTKSTGKCPIYWKFTSGKNDAFAALIYIHSYNRDTIGTIRTEYLYKTIDYYEKAIEQAEYIIFNTNSSSEKAKLLKRKNLLLKYLEELKMYSEAITTVALQRIDMDLDVGVKKNYQLFQNIEISTIGKVKKTISLLEKI